MSIANFNPVAASASGFLQSSQVSVGQFPPLYSLPPVVRNACCEAHTNIKAPMEIVFSSALSVLSLVSQGLVDVRMHYGQICPVSLFLNVIANSGERKTSTDKKFMSAVHIFAEKMRLQTDQAKAEFDADFLIWELTNKAICAKIMKLEDGEESETLIKLKTALKIHIATKPVEPRSLDMILSDATFEAIGWHMHRVSPSVGLMSDEGGIILDSLSANKLPSLNDIWGGGGLSVNRRTTDSFQVPDARMTLSVMVQEKTFKRFLKAQGSLARDNGLLARCLISFPFSMQGFRENNSIQEPTWACLDEFNSRVSELLEIGQTALNDKDFKRTVLDFSPDAKIHLAAYANHVERQSGPNCILFDVGDAAAKSPEQAARIAALFHLFQGRTGEIQFDSIEQGCQIADWYLGEFKRLFSVAPPIPQEELDASVLDSWLRTVYKNTGRYILKRNDVRQRGPNQLRSKARLEAAISILINFGKIQMIRCPNINTWSIEFFVNSAPFYRA